VAARSPSHLAVDLTLPGISGLEVLSRLARHGCRSRVLIVSGAGSADIAEALAEARRLGLRTGGVLPKPFRQAQLRELLDLD
jgi:FixJ family two-component response regulator